MAEYAKDVLVDTQWVEDHLDDSSIRIVEVVLDPLGVDENVLCVFGHVEPPSKSSKSIGNQVY